MLKHVHTKKISLCNIDRYEAVLEANIMDVQT